MFLKWAAHHPVCLCSCSGFLWDRWAPEMESAGLRQTHWRKSSMWSMLTRKHAQAVVDDTEVCPLTKV